MIHQTYTSIQEVYPSLQVVLHLFPSSLLHKLLEYCKILILNLILSHFLLFENFIYTYNALKSVPTHFPPIKLLLYP